MSLRKYGHLEVVWPANCLAVVLTTQCHDNQGEHQELHYIRLTAFFQINMRKPAPERWTFLDFTGARDDGVQWHQLDHMHLIPDR